MVKRSRELWDEAQRPNASWMALVRAILYELQPIRFSSLDFSAIQSSTRTIRTGLVSFTTESVPAVARGSYSAVRSMSRCRWLWMAVAISYFYGIRYIHRILDAGPMVLIISALVAIFTIGLDDSSRGDGVSAYSVFNRGFQRLLGSVDVESLVAQHVGGAMGVAGMGLAGGMPPEPENDGREEQGPVGVARLPPANEEDNEEQDDNNNDAPNNTSRKSGKKARRGNLEQRRELQRQRQAALAMGFAGDGSPEEMMAMQRLLEEQIAANNNDGNNNDDET